MPAKMESSFCELASSLPAGASLCPTLVPWLRPGVQPVQPLISSTGHKMGILEELPQGDILGKGRMGPAHIAGDVLLSGLPAIEAFQLWKLPEPCTVCILGPSQHIPLHKCLFSLSSEPQKRRASTVSFAEGSHRLHRRGTVLLCATPSEEDQSLIGSELSLSFTLLYLTLEPHHEEQRSCVVTALPSPQGVGQQ